MNNVSRASHLDGLRGCAALIVVFAHFCQMFLPAVFSTRDLSHNLGEQALATTPLNILVHGQMAVSIFFVLSGIVLAAPFFERGNRHWYIGAALKRYPRLAIPAIGSTVFAWLVAVTFGFHYATATPASGASMPNFFGQINSFAEAVWQGAVGAFFYGEDAYNKVLWTIGIEVKGSYLVFLLAPLLGPFKLRWLAYLALAWWLRESHLLAFLLGVTIADVLKNQPRLHPAISACIAAVGLWAASYPYYGAEQSIWTPLHALGIHPLTIKIVGAALLLLGICTNRTLQTGLSVAPLRYLGRISFGLYLTHFTVLASAAAFVLSQMVVNYTYAMSVAAAAAVALPLCIFAAHIFTIGVDEPTIRLTNRLGKLGLFRGAGLSPGQRIGDA
jgi:peptidoglycan/LPS O-acetylase OafA/YrhL